MSLLIFTCVLFSQAISSSIYEGVSSSHVIRDPLSKFSSVDYSKTSKPLLLKSRVMDLMNGEHFDDILRDTPNNMRPPSLILFYNTTLSLCQHEFNQLNFEEDVIKHLPSRGFLFVSQYDINAAPQRLWYKFTPERDLVSRFNVNPNRCLSLVYVTRECDGFTNWCVNKVENNVEYLGCDNFVDHCKNFEEYPYSNGLLDNGWIKWVQNKLELPENIINIGGPNPDRKFSTMVEQENWIKGRDGVTTSTQLRNAYTASALPAFTKLGYKVVNIPDDIMREFIEFYNKYKHERRNENWESYGQTQVNGHEVSPYLIYMDLDMGFRDGVANNFIKPLLEQWVGFELELTSHYGLREYHSGSWLRNHVDREDVLVISVTLSLFHIKNSEKNNDLTLNTIDTWNNSTEWPIEAIDFNGNNVRYNHKPGTMVFYESAKLIHGRPYPMPFGKNNEDLIHIGSFCHFTPKDGSWVKNGHPTNAQNNVHRFKKHERSINTPSFRPPNDYKGEL